MRSSLGGSHCPISLASLTCQSLLFTCPLFLQLPWLRSHCPVMSSHAVWSNPELRNCQWVALRKLPDLSVAGCPPATTGKGRGKGGGKKEEEEEEDNDMESSSCHISRCQGVTSRPDPADTPHALLAPQRRLPLELSVPLEK